MSERMDFAGGKYTVINENGKLTALRYGEPWGRDEDLVGDNLVYSMLVDSLRLKEQGDMLLGALKSTGLFLHHCWCDVQMNDYSFEKLNQQMAVVDAAIKAVEGETK